MNILEAIILGAVQGITTFLPVSSVGHLVLTRSVFGVTDTVTLLFQAVLYFATAAALITYFFPDIWLLTQVGLRKLGKLPVNKRDETLLYALLAASVPAVIFGLTMDTIVSDAFSSPFLVAGVLVVGSIFFMYAEWVYQSKAQTNIINTKKGMKIGFFQVLSLIPGMSRFGAAIAGGMLMGLSRVEAARFAFLLAVPILLSMGLKSFVAMLMTQEVVSWLPVLAGAVVAFGSSLFAVGFMMRFVRKHTLWPFIWYRIILAAFVVFVTLFG